MALIRGTTSHRAHDVGGDVQLAAEALFSAAGGGDAHAILAVFDMLVSVPDQAVTGHHFTSIRFTRNLLGVHQSIQCDKRSIKE